jgi:hypothetical protein
MSLWRSFRRCFNDVTGRNPKTNTAEALERIRNLGVGRDIEWPLTPTMEDVALKSDDQKVKKSAIGWYAYRCPNTGEAKAVNIAVKSKNPEVQEGAIDSILASEWNRRRAIKSVVAKSENPEIGVYALQALSSYFNDNAPLYASRIKEMTSLSLDIVSEYNDDERVQSLTRNLVSQLNSAVPAPEFRYDNPNV